MPLGQSNTTLDSFAPVSPEQRPEFSANAFGDKPPEFVVRTNDNVVVATPVADVKTSMARLNGDVAQNLSESARQEFNQDLESFMLGAKQKGFSQEEISRTLESTARLLEGKGEQPLDQEKRVWLALSLMHNLSHPNRIDQGFHNTCNVTALSKVLLAEDPARFTEMVCNTALDGCYHAPDGRTIKIDANSLAPDNEACGGETREERRNYATQIFDLVSINNYWQRQFPPFTYVQQDSQWSGDTGERLLNAFGKPVNGSDGNVLTNPNLDCRAMCAIGHELGMKDEFLVASAAAHQVAHEVIHSPEELAASLKKILATGHPAMLEVESGNKLFTGKYGVNGGGWHVVTIDSYDPSTGQFHMSNQWGSYNDQSVSIADLYDSTLPPNLWAYCPDYYKPKTFETYMNHMVEGGAGLDPNQIKTSSEYERWMAQQKAEMKRDMMHELGVLDQKLARARAMHDENEVSRLEGWIRQTRAGLDD